MAFSIRSRLLLLLSAGVFISACAPVTESTIRIDNSSKRSFSINQPYQSVFQKVLDQSRACFLNRADVVQWSVAGDRNNRDKTGEIVVAELFAKKGREVFILFDVESVTEQETLVKAYAASRKGQVYLKSVRSWVENNESACIAGV